MNSSSYWGKIHMMQRYTAFIVCGLVLGFTPSDAFVAQSTHVLAAQRASSGDPVQLDSGIVSGRAPNNAGVRSFKGIPYAAPPVGNLRWRPPVRPKPWAGVRAATEFAANCMQAVQPGDPPISEDCLYLNVWTGARSSSERRPVLVWIHGGGFTSGSGRDPRTHGEHLAGRGVVTVTFDYRVGVFGFFAHPQLTEESDKRMSGNYGVHDQIAALEWVQRNIAAFGGDPQNVTLGGNSAGALCVNVLVASPMSKGLFRRVIAESGAAVGSFSSAYPNSLTEAERAGLDYMKLAQTESLAQLRDKAAGDLMKTGSRGRLTVDGHVLPKEPYDIFMAGGQNDVPILTGWNQDDVAGAVTAGAEAFKQSVRRQYGANAETILRAFPGNSDEQARKSAANLSRDVLFAWQGYTWIRLQERTGKSPSYTYFFTRVPPGTSEETARGAYHGSESPYALDNLDKFTRPWTDVDKKLSRTMSSYWINYITTGNPNGPGLLSWPAFSIKDDQVMEFGDTIRVRPTPFRDEMDALDRVFEKMRESRNER